VIPVEQQELAEYDDAGESSKRGDCLRACMASLFELPLEEVPHFVASDNWFGLWIEWLNERGFGIWQARISTHEDDKTRLTGYPSQGTMWLATVLSPRIKAKCRSCEGAGFVWSEYDYEKGERVHFAEETACRWCEGTGRVPGLHAILMQGKDVLYDPHPQREMGHLGFVDGTIFVALDPGRLTLRD
jgi:hypothetical protein